MDTWTNRLGFPLLTVTTEMENGNRILTITQTKFTYNASPDPNCETWLLPISILTESCPNEVNYLYAPICMI